MKPGDRVKCADNIVWCGLPRIYCKDIKGVISKEVEAPWCPSGKKMWWVDFGGDIKIRPILEDDLEIVSRQLEFAFRKG
jgi:hypothetical protein